MKILNLKNPYMLNKILVFWWMAVGAVLVIENMVVSSQAYLLIYNSRTWSLALFSIIVWIAIGYGLRWFYSKDEYKDDSLDF